MVAELIAGVSPPLRQSGSSCSAALAADLPG
jgi:hypothetical protein